LLAKEIASSIEEGVLSSAQIHQNEQRTLLLGLSSGGVQPRGNIPTFVRRMFQKIHFEASDRPRVN
jgi:hypothetical protein